MAETLKEKTAKGLFWGAMNNGAMQVIGLVFGIIKVAIILGLLVLAFEALNSALNILDADQLENAVVYGKLRELGGDIFPKLKELITGIDG